MGLWETMSFCELGVLTLNTMQSPQPDSGSLPFIPTGKKEIYIFSFIISN